MNGKDAFIVFLTIMAFAGFAFASRVLGDFVNALEEVAVILEKSGLVEIAGKREEA